MNILKDHKQQKLSNINNDYQKTIDSLMDEILKNPNISDYFKVQVNIARTTKNKEINKINSSLLYKAI